MSVKFYFEAVPKFSWKVLKVKKWVAGIAQNEKFKISDVSYVFCTDSYLLDINQAHLQHDTFTDIITFDLRNDTNNRDVEGEIYISIDRVKENATKFKVSFEQELARVMAHGILHLCGYKDKKPSEIKTMRDKEDFYLSTFPNE